MEVALAHTIRGFSLTMIYSELLVIFLDSHTAILGNMISNAFGVYVLWSPCCYTHVSCALFAINADVISFPFWYYYYLCLAYILRFFFLLLNSIQIHHFIKSFFIFTLSRQYSVACYIDLFWWLTYIICNSNSALFSYCCNNLSDLVAKLLKTDSDFRWKLTYI